MKDVIIPKSKLSDKSAVRKVVGDLIDRSGVEQLSEQEKRDLAGKVFEKGRENLTREEARGIIADVAFNEKNFRAAEKLRRALGLRRPRRSDLPKNVGVGSSDRVERIEMKRKLRMQKEAEQKARMERKAEKKMEYDAKRRERLESRGRLSDEVSQKLMDQKRDRDNKDYLRGQLGHAPGKSDTGVSGVDTRPNSKPSLY